MSQQPLGWLKVRCYAELTGTTEEDKQLSPFHIWLSAGDWLLLGWGKAEEKAVRVSLVGSGVVVCYSLFWTHLREVVFGLVGQPVGQTAGRISPWG